MSLPEHIAAVSDVDERFQGFYEEDDAGGFKLQDPNALNRSLKNAKTEKLELRNKVQSLTERLEKLNGLDADEFARMKAENERLKNAGPDSDANFNAWKADAQANWDKKETGFKTQISTLSRLLEKEAVDAPLLAALQEAGATKEGMKALPDLLRAEVKIKIDDDGRLERQVLRPDGTLRYNDQQEPMSILDRALEARQEFPSLFSGSDKSGPGGGAAGGVKLEGAFAGKKPSTMSPKEKVDFQNRYGRDAWTKLVQQELNAQ